MNVFLSVELNPVQSEYLQKRIGTDAIVYTRTDYRDDAEFESVFADCEVVFGNVPATWLVQNSQLRWAQLDSVGFGEYRNLDWTRLGRRLILTNLAGFFAEPVAQSMLAGILARYRGIDTLARLQQRKDWQGDPLREQLRSLLGAEVVLFGFGSINRRLLELLAPFHCRTKTFASGWTATELDQALATADIIACAAPETDATLGVFDARRLALLKPDALFVNFGRGSVVDELALADALQNQRLAGAVLDVTDDEPLPLEHPFWGTPNTILTQHSGGGSGDELDRKIDVFAENLTRYRAGQPLLSVVDFDKGY